MAFDVGAIIGRLKLDKSGWDSSVASVKKDEKKIQGFTQRNSANFKKMGTAMTVAGAAIIGSIGLMIKNYVTMGDEVQKMALRTGFATETLSELSFAAQISGADISSLEKGVKKMQKTIVDAGDGLSTYVRAFERIGIAVEDLAGLSPEEQFLKIGEAIAGVEDPTIRTASAMDIFGRAGTQLLPLFAEGVEGMRELREEARRLGVVFDQEAADKAARLADAQLRLTNAFKGVGLALADNLIPMISGFVEKMAITISKITAWTKANPGLTNVITKLAAGIGGLLLALGPLVVIIPKLVLGFASMKLKLLALPGPLKTIAGVGAAAFVGWKVGRLIGELTGLDKVIEKTASKIIKKLGLWQGSAELASDRTVILAKRQKLLEDATKKAGFEITSIVKANQLLNGTLKAVDGKLVVAEKSMKKTAKTIKDDLTPAIEEVQEATESWLDFLNNVGFKTFKQQQERIVILQGHLKNLDEEYEKGQISLEAYRIATKAVNDEIDDLSTSVIDTAIPAVRDMSGVLDQAVGDMKTKIGEFPPAVEGAMTKVVDIMSTRWGDVIRGMSGAFGQFVFDVLSTGSTFSENLKGLWEGVKNTFKNVVADMAAEWAENFIKKLITKGATAVVEVGKNILDLGKSVTGAITSIGSAASGIFVGIGAAVGTFLGSLIGKKTTGWQKAMQALSLQTTQLLFNIRDLMKDSVIVILKELEKQGWRRADQLTEMIFQSRTQSKLLGSAEKKFDRQFNIFKSMDKQLGIMAKSLKDIVAGGLRGGAVVTKPTIKLIGEDAPRIPEIVIPEPDFQNIMKRASRSGAGQKGKIEINVHNKVDLNGQIITTEEHVKRTLIPLIMEALKTNVGMTQLTDILKAKGVI